MSPRRLSWTVFWLAACSLGLAVLGFAVAVRENVQTFCSDVSSSSALSSVGMLFAFVVLLLAIAAAVRFRDRAAFVAITLALVAGFVDFVALIWVTIQRCPV